MQLSSGKPLPSPVLSSIFRSRTTYLAGRSERGGGREGEGSRNCSASDGCVVVGSNFLSSPRNHCTISPVSVAILLHSCNKWPGFELMTAQSLHMGQPICSLSLLFTKPPSTVISVGTSQSCPPSRCHASQMWALSQCSSSPPAFHSPSGQLPHLSCLHIAPLCFSLSLPFSVPQTDKTCVFCQGHIEIRKSPSSTLGWTAPLFCREEL